MNQTIWKFQIPTNTNTIFKLAMPIGAKILHTAYQYGVVCLWALCDTKAAFEVRNFHVYGTGCFLPNDSLTYVGSVIQFDGNYIWHLFEDKK